MASNKTLQSGVQIKGVGKSFGPTVVLHKLDLEIQPGEFMVLVGPSGCGKSTLLRLVAGLEETTEGSISINGKIVNELSPKARGVAMVFQNYALYPHMTVKQNMTFALRLSKLPPAEIESRVAQAAKVLGLEEQLEKKPGHLSGGQKQRVAMGRAMVRQPAVFLFDEPLSNLDAQLRVKMRAEISMLHRRLESTVIYVTHDQVEAMTLADRIAVMHKGKLEQVGPPLEVYHNPKTKFVASFIGTPSMNFLPAKEAARFKVPGGASTVGFRPETTTLRTNGNGLSISKGKVGLIEPLGVTAHVHVQTSDGIVVAETKDGAIPKLDEEVSICVDEKSLFFFDSNEPDCETAPAPRVALTVSHSSLSLGIFVVYPALNSLYLSLFEVEPFAKRSHFVGLSNYTDLFSSGDYWHTIYISFLFTVMTVIPSIVMSLIAALALDSNPFCRGFFRTVFLLPVAISSAMAAMLWIFIYNPTAGYLNYALDVMGVHGPNWLGDPHWALAAVAIATIWKEMGFNVIFFLAGLSSVPTELREASLMDGANRFQRFWHVVLPVLSPTMFFVGIVSVINSLQSFGQIHILTMGGPAGETTNLVYKLYRDAFENFRTGYASAQAVVLFLLILVATLVQFRFAGRKVHYG